MTAPTEAEVEAVRSHLLALHFDIPAAHVRAALTAAAALRSPAAGEAVAWVRRWAFDGVDCMALAKADRPKGWNMHATSAAKLFSDDVPLYLHPPSTAAALEEAAKIVGNMTAICSGDDDFDDGWGSACVAAAAAIRERAIQGGRDEP